MKPMAITILKRPEVDNDLDEAADYIAEDNSEAAIRFLQTLNEKLTTLAQNPLMGRLRPELLTRLRSFPFGDYIVFYIPIENGIEIVRFLHSARDIERIFDA
jgi:toxin ParE1/3/4